MTEHVMISQSLRKQYRYQAIKQKEQSKLKSERQDYNEIRRHK